MASDFKNQVLRHHIVGVFLFCMTAAAVSVSDVCRGETASGLSPAFGLWKGFHVGDYAVEKRIYRGLSFRKDGEEYRKTFLLNVSGEGEAVLCTFAADKAEGPWKPGLSSLAGGDEAGLRASMHKKELPPETITVGNRTFICRVEQTTDRDDYGTKIKTRWIDPGSGLDLKREEAFDGQYPDGKSWRWTLSRLTTGIQTVTVGTNRLACFVQDQRQTVENADELRWHELVAAQVPGHVVTSTYSSKKAGPPEVETSLLAWGRDPGLIAEFERLRPELGIVTDEDIQKEREAEEVKRQREVDELEKSTLATLKSPDESTRAEAVRCLANWPISEANKSLIIEALKGALDDPSATVRRQAALGVGRRGVKGMSGQIQELLRRDPEGVDFYVQALGLQKDPKGLPPILDYASATNRAWRSAATVALGNFETDEARLALEKAVADPDGDVSLRAVESLAKIGDPRSVPALLRVLRHPSPVLVQAAIGFVARHGDDNAVPALLELLDSPYEITRMSLCGCLGQMKLKDPRPAGDALLKKLEEPSLKVRFMAAVALGELHERRAVPKLLAIAQSPDDSTNIWFNPHLAAVAALGRIGDPAAVPVLVKLLEQPGQHQVVCEALANLGEPAAKPLLTHSLRATNETIQFQALKALSQVGTKETVAALREYVMRCPPPRKPAIRKAIQDIEQRLPR